MSTIFLIAAIVGLALGPALFALLHRSPAPQLAVDGFVLVAITGLVAFHVLPDAFESAGFIALFAAAAGLLLPLLVERVKALSSRMSHGIVLAVAFSALMLHASLDGVGVAASEGSIGLALAVVLHRLPVGLSIWWLVRPQFGRRWAFAVLGAIAIATVGGFAFQTGIVETHTHGWVHLVQAFVAGSLLHVLLHQAVGFHDHTVEESRWRIPGAIGGVLAIGLVAGLPLPGGHDHGFGQHFLDVALIASPLLVVLFAGGFVVLAVRRTGSFGGRALRALDTMAPWAVAALVVGAIVTEEPEVAVSVANATSLTVLGLLTLLSLAHQGPRDFLMEVLPLDLLGAHDHDHSHDHDAAHAHGQGGA